MGHRRSGIKIPLRIDWHRGSEWPPVLDRRRAAQGVWFGVSSGPRRVRGPAAMGRGEGAPGRLFEEDDRLRTRGLQLRALSYERAPPEGARHTEDRRGRPEPPLRHPGPGELLYQVRERRSLQRGHDSDRD